MKKTSTAYPNSRPSPSKPSLILVYALFALFSGGIAQGQIITSTQIARQIGYIGFTTPTNAQLNASGFVFGPSNDVVTCLHVFTNLATGFHVTNLYFFPGSLAQFSLTPKGFFTNDDLAVFSPTPKMTNITEPFKSGKLASLRVGEPVVYFGYDPRLTTNNSVFLHGQFAKISLVDQASNDSNGFHSGFFEFEGGDTTPGYSGSAVFNTNGELVGIVSAVIGKADGRTVTRAMSLDGLSGFLTNAAFGTVTN